MVSGRVLATLPNLLACDAGTNTVTAQLFQHLSALIKGHDLLNKASI